MTVFVIGKSALELLRAPAFDKRGLTKREPALPVDFGKPPREELEALSRLGIAVPASIAVGARENRVSSKMAHSRLLSSGVPRGSFLRYDQNLFVACPELVFVQLCLECDVPRALRAGYELCGGYAIDSLAECHLRQRHPVTSKLAIESFLSEAAGVNGAKQARRLLPYLSDGSRSPRETALTLLLCLPQKYGGYGLPLPQLNFRITGRGGRAKPEKPTRYGDLVWVDERVVLEYDSMTFHAGGAEIDRDSKRRAGLESLGFKVITCTNGQILKESELCLLARAIARSISYRFRISSDELALERRRSLRAVLLGCRYAE